MKWKIISLFILLLFISADYGAPITADYCKPSLKEYIGEIVDTPVDNMTNNSSSDSPIIKRIKYFNPNATLGEVIAVNTFLEEQLNHTNTSFNLSLYTSYIRNDSNYPLGYINLTADELAIIAINMIGTVAATAGHVCTTY